ncbi:MULTISPECIES: MAE_28990/MAE_18760 family HEPN-like nuclease [Burkholderia]|uniref:MAE_28990/MAE_18760 family HEPN-like nuclease n=1 Tax=Burkholderia TaxID=32008 RepID=UPI0015889550|nr:MULTISPECIES: MAE_28990/MAE_18760 family HEPN-like nuclease [Burkholderia]MCU9953759.1 MAE_28990/MAE_18760 family HEPN-like nuclease [Burkholderia sp. BKH01]
MSKVYTEEEFSNLLDGNLVGRIRELSDLKSAVFGSNYATRDVLLKAVVALSYANWEGFVKFSAQRYFDFIVARRLPFSRLNPQFYKNSFLARLNGLSTNKVSLTERCALVDDILGSRDKGFRFVNKDLINTGSNLKFSVLQDICAVCGLSWEKFSEEEDFIDRILLKRRNAIAHGDEAEVAIGEVEDIIQRTVGLMRHFKNELENAIYSKFYLAA